VDTFSVTGTLDGSFNVGSRKWYWDVNGVYGLNDAHQLFTGNVNAANLARALGPVAQCTGGCVPFNIFGGAGSVTQPMLDYVTFDERDKSQQELWDFQANLSGDLFDLPGGAVGFALGYEHRNQRASYDPDPLIVAGLGADVPTSPARGAFNVDEFYGELRVPLITDKPFFNRLELGGAVRHSNYSTFGSNTTFTGTGLWKPVADLLLRGGYAESLRAPSIGELYAGLSRFDATIDDPCTSAAGGSFTSNATVRANCIANGVPASGSYAEPTGGQLGVFSQGSTSLRPETSRTWTAGAVYSPAWARRGFASALSLEVNFYDIDLQNAIDSVPANYTLSRCAFDGDPASCAAIQRTASGTIAGISGRLLNLNGIKTQGIDTSFVFRSVPVGPGTVGLNVNAAFLFKYDVVTPDVTGATVIHRKGTERGSPDQAYPSFKLNGTLDYSTPAAGASFTGRFINAVREGDGNRLGNTFYGDIQVYVSPGWLDHRVRLTAGVNNVFDKDPPACFTCDSANFDPTTYDVPGQFGYLRLSYGL
jgi:iron complex outermembrane receptor protein